MTIDAKGYIYVTGTTTSVETASTDQFPVSNLPQTLPYQNLSRAPGLPQFFVTKVNINAPKTGSIAYSTYFGGGNFETADPIATGGGIAVDTNGNIYFAGTTNFTFTGCQGCQTTDFPILNPYQPCLDQIPPTVLPIPLLCSNTNNSASDAFVAKLNPNVAPGAQLLWSTYVGGAGTDSGTGIALDAGAANVYLTGTTNSSPFTALTTFAPYQLCLDAPAVKVLPCPTAFKTDPPPTDAFVARLTNPATSTVSTSNLSLSYFSYLGGSDNDTGAAITVDVANGALMTGWTQSTDFPVLPNPNGIQSQLNGTQDAFVARVNTVAVTGANAVASWANYFGGSGIDEGTDIALDNNQTVYLAGDTNSTDLRVSSPLATNTTNNGGYDAFVTKLGTASSLTITGSLQLGVNQVYISAGNPATFTYIVTNNGPDLATNITVTDDISVATTVVPLTFQSAGATSSGNCGGGATGTTVSCSIPALQAGSTATVTIVLTPTPNSAGGSATFNGGTVSANAPSNTTPATTSVSAKMSDFSISVSPNSNAVPIAGGTASYQVQLFPNPVYASNISLTCSGLPPASSCGFSPASATLSSGPAAPVLVITTTARPINTTAGLFSRHFYALWLPVPGLALLGLGVGSDRRRRRMAGIVLLCVVLLLLVLQPACSSSTAQPPPSGTPAGTYPLTVTATSGSDTKNAPISLTVP